MNWFNFICWVIALILTAWGLWEICHPYTKCDQCNGHGWLKMNWGREPCPTCNGTGHMPKRLG